MTRWPEHPTRKLMYRVVNKARAEAEVRFGPTVPLRRALAKVNSSSLAWLAAVYGSDKGVVFHGYVDLYERYLHARRRRIRRVLELGIHRGASLEMWRDFFPNAEIFGVDIKPVEVCGSRIHTLVGDQSDPELLQSLRGLGPWDLVVDDGSHVQSHILASFDGLYSSVACDGYYVIEDMHTAYVPTPYEGGPPGMGGTSVALIRRLVDGVNRQHADLYPDEAAELPSVDAVYVHEKIAFIHKPDSSKARSSSDGAQHADRRLGSR